MLNMVKLSFFETPCKDICSDAWRGVIWYLWHLVFPSFSNKINYTQENQLCASCENLN